MTAPKYKRHVPKDGSRHRLTTYIAVSLFVLVDVALIGWALNSTRGAPTAPQAVEISAATTPQAEPTQSSTPEPTAAAPTFTLAEAVTPTRIITALNATTAWRAQTGPCPATAAEPEYTLDGGVTWTTTDASGPTDVTAIQSITVEADGIASMVALAGTDCAPEFVKTFVAGDNYRAYDDQLENNWYVDPDEPMTVVSPSGSVDSPCGQVVALAPTSQNTAAVLCSDQTVFMTDSGGVDWIGPVSAPSTVGISASVAGYRLASVGNADCAGIQLGMLLPGQSAVDVTGCLLSETITAESAGDIAVSEAEGSVWVWAQDQVSRTADGGATWE